MVRMDRNEVLNENGNVTEWHNFIENQLKFQRKSSSLIVIEMPTYLLKFTWETIPKFK